MLNALVFEHAVQQSAYVYSTVVINSLTCIACG